jgi:peptidoglycan/LPS O-acetylase OafA/YrhL
MIAGYTTKKIFKPFESTRIPSFDGLRAISILMVMYGHMLGTHYFFPIQSITNPSRWYMSDLENLGVRIILSFLDFLLQH